MANVFIFVSAIIVFFIPFGILFGALYAAALRKKGMLPAKKTVQRHSRHQQVRPYDPTTNTADYPSACQASYNPERAKDQLDTLLKAGHITHEEYRLRIDQLKNYKHC